MKFSEQWLRQRVNLKVTTEELLERFTMAGLEVEAVENIAAPFTQVVVGLVDSIEKHPDAEKLTICHVSIGNEENLQIVCGASNVAPKIKVAVALIGASINGTTLKKSKLRGLESFGMLCSAKELGLAESSQEILILPDDAPLGKTLREYMQLDDVSIAMDLTPNRGDCLALEGIAREAAALCEVDYAALTISPIIPSNDAQFPVQIDAKQDCPHYVGRVIRDININTNTPLWMTERLRRSGIKSVDPVVDVTNYVMIELGQPLHAFDLDTLDKKIIIRKAYPHEFITLLNAQTLELNTETLVIADAKKPLAIAGIMGGDESKVNKTTTNLFLESAFFAPQLIMGKARLYGLHTDSSHRFERGVDVNLQVKAIERATALLLEIVGGSPGPIIEEGLITEVINPDKQILLRPHRLAKILGCNIADDTAIAILKRLGMTVRLESSGWQVQVPSYRFDIHIEEDLIEEVGRVYGYNRIPHKKIVTILQHQEQSDYRVSLRQAKATLIEREYCEVITYSFVDPKIQTLLHPDLAGFRLLNPISEELSEMRLSLLPGLVSTLLYNKNRQQQRIRLFETGLKFVKIFDELKQDLVIGGIATGPLYPQQWGIKNRLVDFFDIKKDVESLIELTGDTTSFQFLPLVDSSVLHPGQSAYIIRKDKVIGFIGVLHPKIMQQLEMSDPIIIFELLFNDLASANLAKFATLSKYPAIRRDLAILVDEGINVDTLCRSIRDNAGKLLVDLVIFDVYQGLAEKTGQKSVAFGLMLQHQERTLIDEEVNQLIEKLIKQLHYDFKAVLRN